MLLTIIYVVLAWLVVGFVAARLTVWTDSRAGLNYDRERGFYLLMFWFGPLSFLSVTIAIIYVGCENYFEKRKSSGSRARWFDRLMGR